MWNDLKGFLGLGLVFWLFGVLFRVIDLVHAIWLWHKMERIWYVFIIHNPHINGIVLKQSVLKQSVLKQSVLPNPYSTLVLMLQERISSTLG
jgi:hypothetical protein